MSWYRNVFGDDEDGQSKRTEPWPLFQRAMAKLANRRRIRAERIRNEKASLLFAIKVWNEEEWMRWYKTKYPNDKPAGIIPHNEVIRK